MAFNWEKASDIGGKITVLSCFAFSVLGLTTATSPSTCVYTLFVGFLMAVLELPVIYFCFPQVRPLPPWWNITSPGIDQSRCEWVRI